MEGNGVILASMARTCHSRKLASTKVLRLVCLQGHFELADLVTKPTEELDVSPVHRCSGIYFSQMLLQKSDTNGQAVLYAPQLLKQGRNIRIADVS
ncbi:hypothetical protein CHELA41_40176 [Hyphomicrobiales bacterium]|nr:hypothetical protein CHELA41_40176 [Hyphomicrobiales bacterium]